MHYRIYILLFFVVITSATYAQADGRVKGQIVAQSGEPVGNATIKIGKQLTTSQSSGYFELQHIPTGKHFLQVSAIGYETFQDSVIKKQGEDLVLKILLATEDRVIQQIDVVGKTETQQIKEQPIRSIVVDTRAVAEQPVSLAELMNRSPGIRIRQSGGLGNAVDVSINGFQGNAVQYFRDGIPLEYLGGGYGINNVPVNQLERVEVYKGVVPVSLGGDALGGAVNLVRPKHQGSSLQASYEIASFNTHIVNLSGYHSPAGKKWFGGLDAFFNYSDNDYKADVEVVNENANLEPVSVKLFHNGYRHQFAELYAGVKDKAWTDELRFSIATYGISRESQHPSLMTNPYGAITLKNRGVIPSVRYMKSFWDDKLSFDQFGSYSFLKRNRTDTVRGTYDWYGNFTPRTGDGIGESPTPSLSDIDFTNAISRSHFDYKLNDTHSLQANVVYNYNRRIGRDPYGFRFTGTDIDVLSKEAVYQKTIAGLAWESKWLEDKFTNQLSVKYFNFMSKGINAFLSNDTDLNKYTTATDDNWGIANALKYQIDSRSFIRASAELTNRLPREEELFGNNDTRAPNFNLKPERSFNVNLGYSYMNERYAMEVGTFYRKTRGMILLVPVQPPFSQYQNLDSIQGYGFDIDLSYRLPQNMTISGNLTWQDNRMIDIGTPLYKWIEGTRLRNSPFFFANLALTGAYGHVFRRNDVLKPYLHYNFIREFYLIHVPRDKEPQGFLGIFGKSGVPITDLVPDQSLISTGFNYILPSSNFVLGLEMKNLLDSKLYDYYKVQRPGRSIHFKINYQIKSIKS